MDELAPLPDMAGESLLDLLHAGTDPVMAASIRQMLESVHDGTDPISAWSSVVDIG